MTYWEILHFCYTVGHPALVTLCEEFLLPEPYARSHMTLTEHLMQWILDQGQVQHFVFRVEELR